MCPIDAQSETDSPESQVLPWEDVNSKQCKITGEKFPTLVFGICDKCNWCYSSIGARYIIKICFICKSEISQIPMNIDEQCTIEKDKERGIILRFNRKLPLR